MISLGPPERFCRSVPIRERSPRVAPDEAPLEVALVGGRLRVESRGASAGRLIVAMAEAAGQAVAVRGRGARVRIYAHVSGGAFDELLQEVADAAGLVVDRREGLVEVLDPDLWVTSERSRRAATLQLIVETRVLFVDDPVAAARVVAEVALSCQGRVVAAPRRHALLVTDIGPTVERVEVLLRALSGVSSPGDAGDAAVPLEVSEERRTTYGVPDHWMPSCDLVPPRPAPLLAADRTQAEGEAAGDLLRALAGRAGQDVVVGCHGDRPAFLRGEPEDELQDLAQQLGLRPVGRTTYSSPEISHAFRWRSVAMARSSEVHEVRLIRAPLVSELAQVVREALGDHVSVAAYPSASVLVASGGEPELSIVEELAELWREGARPPPSGP